MAAWGRRSRSTVSPVFETQRRPADGGASRGGVRAADRVGGRGGKGEPGADATSIAGGDPLTLVLSGHPGGTVVPPLGDASGSGR